MKMGIRMGPTYAQVQNVYTEKIVRETVRDPYPVPSPPVEIPIMVPLESYSARELAKALWNKFRAWMRSLWA